MGRLLVTGFGAFPGAKVNPIDRLAHAVAARLRGAGQQAKAVTLPVTYGGGLALLRHLLKAEKPAAVLMLGLGSRIRFVRVERYARDNPSILHPDAGGAAARAVAGGALPMRARAPLGAALAALTRQGIRARLSPSAGRYLCNAAYATALAGLPPSVPVLFVHVPYPRPAPGTRPAARVRPWRPHEAALVRALTGIAGQLERHRR